ncbi:hypothetical protein J2X85_000562 [Microbacterium trichothecenolyticum]|uniref:DUF2278 family protein n=1 Tax=Microbacterium trichothecenolyticum TaxID=69370 RepID=UPI002865B617|nr:DUF2278 family protein [Microbacterium trichothecenolyticum]MDR7183539.1 hypothetical protein [Microbacterium trichothecenolyticum]
MPFTQYGVLSGTLVSHERDDPDEFGRWWHVNLKLRSGARDYRVAVDVDSKNSAAGVQWKTIRTTGARLGWPAPPAPAFTKLLSSPTSGALDVIRHRELRVVGIRWFLQWLFRARDAVAADRSPFWVPFLRPWRSGDQLQASQALEATLRVGALTLVWGEPFPEGAAPASVQGIHNVHQNQGDPAGSQWFPENGIWQDGGVATQQPDGSWVVFISKFSTQSDRTDSLGHPV